MAFVLVGGLRQGDERPVVVAVAFRARPGGDLLPGVRGQADGDLVGALDAQAGGNPVGASDREDVTQLAL